MGRKVNPIITISMLQELNKLYDEGMNMEELAIKYGLSQSTINNYIWKPRNAGTKVVI